jgi:hypothetical protein
MPDQPYQRTILYPLEKPLADDVNQDWSQDDRSLRESLKQLFGSQNGFLRGSLQVVPSLPLGLSVVINPGLGFYTNGTDTPSAIGGVVGLNDLSAYKPIVLSNGQTIAVPAPPGSNSRIDLIEVAYQRVTDNSQSREFLNPVTSAFSPALVPKTLDFNVDGTLAYYSATAVPTTALAYKSGVVSATPTPPATDTGYMPLCYITVASGVTTITSGDISDQRPLITLGGVVGIIPGTLLNVQFLTGGGGTYTPTPGATKAWVRGNAGGGGGGGVAGSTISAGAGGGGGEGLDTWITNGSQLTGGAYTNGAGGNGGFLSGNGSAGGNSSLLINGTTLNLVGGAGGQGMASAGGCQQSIPGSGGSGGFAGFNLDIAGDPGIGGLVVNVIPGSGGSGGGTTIQGGNGGRSYLGAGGKGAFGGTGGDGIRGYGGGGGGASIESGSTGFDGGDGSGGIWVIFEYA